MQLKHIHSQVNWRVRLRNPWFWVGLCSVILTALQIEPNSLTSWHEVWMAIEETISSPSKLTMVVMAVFSMLTDYNKPTDATEVALPEVLTETLSELTEPTPVAPPATEPAIIQTDAQTLADAMQTVVEQMNGTTNDAK